MDDVIMIEIPVTPEAAEALSDHARRQRIGKLVSSLLRPESPGDDPLAAIFPDPDHSADEVREIVVGQSERNRLLVVSFTERGENIRIISARAATPRERKKHEENPMGGFGHE